MMVYLWVISILLIVIHFLQWNARRFIANGKKFKNVKNVKKYNLGNDASRFCVLFILICI